jgi:hypothetical protein
MCAADTLPQGSVPALAITTDLPWTTQQSSAAPWPSDNADRDDDGDKDHQLLPMRMQKCSDVHLFFNKWYVWKKINTPQKPQTKA